MDVTTPIKRNNSERMGNVDIVDLSSGIPKRANLSSPTAVTNAVPRPKSSRSPNVRRTVTPEKKQVGFLTASPATARSRSAANSPRRSSRTRSLRSCSGPSRADMQDLMKRVKEIQSKAVALSSEIQCDTTQTDKTPSEIEVPSNSSTVGSNSNDGNSTPKVIGHCIRDVAETAVGICRTECAKPEGNHRGDDREFFMDSPEDGSEQDESREKISVSSLSTKTPKNTAHSFRDTRKAVRYPEAINIVDDKRERNHGRRLKKERLRRKRRGGAEERTEVPPTLEIAGSEEDPESLREVRLQMFRKDDEDDTVPKAQLSRALGELVMQDDTIESIQTELEKTKSALQEAQMEMIKKNSRPVTETKDVKKQAGANGAKTKRGREEKDKKQQDQSAKLRSKISELQTEAKQLQSELEKSKADADDKVRRMQDKQEELQAKLDISRVKLRLQAPSIEHPPDSPNVVSLRADIVSLRSQLAVAKSELRKMKEEGVSLDTTSESQMVSLKAKLMRTEKELQELRSKTAGVSDLVRLKSRLQRVENELHNEREGKIPGNTHAVSTRRTDGTEGGLSEILRLRTKLHRAEKEVSETKTRSLVMIQAAKEREERLHTKLREAEKACTEKEEASRSEIKQLNKRISTTDREIAKGGTKLEAELEASREETLRLKAEIEELKNQQLKCSQNPDSTLEFETHEQLKQELKRSKAAEKSMANKITALNMRVDKAEADAEEAQAKVMKLSNLAEHENQCLTTEKKNLDEQMKGSDHHELMAEIHTLKSALANPYDSEPESKISSKAQNGAREKKRSAASLRSDVEQLKTRVAELIELEKRSLEKEETKEGNGDPGEVQQEDANLHKAFVLEAQNHSLQNEVIILRARLAETEGKYIHERSKIKEEHTQRKQLEAEYLRETNKLKMQIIGSNLEGIDVKDQTALEHWKNRFHKSEQEIENMKEEARNEARQKEITIRKIKQERALTATRLANIRNRSEEALLDTSGSVSSADRSKSSDR